MATAVATARARNPDLAAGMYELSAADARITQSKLRPNPELAVDLENFAGSGAARGADALEATLSLSQVVELGGKREFRVSAAQAELDLATVERQAHELDLLAEVTRRFIDVVAAQERLRVAGDAATLAQNSSSAIGVRVDAGRSPEAERSRAKIALTRARIEQRQAESDVQAARVALSAQWGSVEPRFTQARADLFALPPILSLAALAERVESAPDLVRFASDARLKEAELRLARAQARPNLTFSLGVRRFQETNDTGLVAGFSMPLSIADRNQGAISAAQARLRQSAALRQAALLRMRSSLFGLHQEVSATQARVETLRTEALPQAQLALEQTRNGYERGRFSFLELATAQQELLAIEAAAVDAAADYHRLLAELERLTSAALVQTNR
ncbi:MAG TPA: TolC family protein [Steroidobacteraceae bacterium]|nr:TolC family protein [Steroidobacteraceae bacterium]